MSTKSYTQEFKDNVNSGYKAILKWADDHDFQSLPAFSIFLAVITVGLYFNVDAFTPIVGSVAAIGIGIFFEAAIVSWKATTSRKRNDAHQNQIAYWALWLSVLLALAMLVVNLFRIGGEQGFENLAYIIVGVAAAVQVVGYLIYDQANPDKTMTREHSQNEREILRKDRSADFTISEVKADARIIRRIGEELNQIRIENADLPTELMETLLEAARIKLLKSYANGSETVDKATRPMADLNGDGRIGRANQTPMVSIPSVWIPENVKQVSSKMTTTRPLPESPNIEDYLIMPTETPTDATDANELPSNAEESHPEDF